MKFLEFENYHEFKMKTGLNGKDAIMLLLSETEKKERTIKHHISGSKKSKTGDDTF